MRRRDLIAKTAGGGQRWRRWDEAGMSEDTDPEHPKPLSVDRLSILWRRINDHKMVQWGVAYVALAYAIQHAVILTSESFEWSHAVSRISMLLLALGLPVVMTLAWYHGERASRRNSARSEQQRRIYRIGTSANYSRPVCSGGRFVQAGTLARSRKPRGSPSVQRIAFECWAIEGCARDAPAPAGAGTFRSHIQHQPC
jgi:hypothetical protein